MPNPILTNGQPSPQSVYFTGPIENHPVGTRGSMEDGRVFYYTRNTGSAALAVGEVMVRPQMITNHIDRETATNVLTVGSVSVGDITLGATAATASQYRYGYLAVTDGGGQGQIFRINSHSAVASGGTMSDLLLFDAPHTASDAGTTVSLIINAYDTPQQSNTDQQDVLVGIPAVTIAAGNVTAQYGWLQTWGECSVLCGEGIATFGQAVTISSVQVGAAEEDDTATTVSQEPLLGYNVTPLVINEFQIVDLQIRA